MKFLDYNRILTIEISALTIYEVTEVIFSQIFPNKEIIVPDKKDIMSNNP